MVLVIQDESLGEGRQVWPGVPWFWEGRGSLQGRALEGLTWLCRQPITLGSSPTSWPSSGWVIRKSTS